MKRYTNRRAYLTIIDAVSYQQNCQTIKPSLLLYMCATVMFSCITNPANTGEKTTALDSNQQAQGCPSENQHWTNKQKKRKRTLILSKNENDDSHSGVFEALPPLRSPSYSRWNDVRQRNVSRWKAKHQRDIKAHKSAINTRLLSTSLYFLLPIKDTSWSTMKHRRITKMVTRILHCAWVTLPTPPVTAA